MFILRFAKVNVEDTCYMRDLYSRNRWEVPEGDMADALKEAEWLLMVRKFSDIRHERRSLIVADEKNAIADLNIVKQLELPLNDTFFGIKFKNCEKCEVYDITYECQAELYDCANTKLYFTDVARVLHHSGTDSNIDIIYRLNSVCKQIEVFVAEMSFCRIKISGVKYLNTLVISNTMAFVPNKQCISGCVLQSDSKIKINAVALPVYITDTLLDSINSIKTGVSKLILQTRNNSERFISLEIYKNNITYDFTGYELTSGFNFVFNCSDLLDGNEVNITIKVITYKGMQCSTADLEEYGSAFVTFMDVSGNVKQIHITKDGIDVEEF